MSFSYIHKKALQVILFVLHSLGKKAEASRLYLLLYIADIKHLAKYGSLITGDTYIAMKYGPAPLHILQIYQQLKEILVNGKWPSNQKEPIGLNNVGQLIAQESYNAMQLSESEVECLFETMHLYKNASFELLSYISMSTAWNKADINGGINIMDMAMEGGATPEMMAYIELSYNDEHYSFNDIL